MVLDRLDSHWHWHRLVTVLEWSSCTKRKKVNCIVHAPWPMSWLTLLERKESKHAFPPSMLLNLCAGSSNRVKCCLQEIICISERILTMSFKCYFTVCIQIKKKEGIILDSITVSGFQLDQDLLMLGLHVIYTVLFLSSNQTWVCQLISSCYD